MRRIFLLLLAAALIAQQPQEQILLRSTTKLVQLNVVAVDKKGEPVADLKATDFEIVDSGKPQTISFFGMHRAGDLAEKPVTLQQNIFSNRLAGSGVPRSVIVILLDSLNTSWSDNAQARKQVAQFLSTIHPEDRVALYTLGRKIRILHDFTTDSADLLRKLNRYKGELTPDLEASRAPDPNLDPDDPLSAFNDPGGPSQREAEFYTRNRVLNTLGALEAISAHLAGLPGRKSLIWVSGGFPLTMGMDADSIVRTLGAAIPDRQTFYGEVTRTVRQLNHADVAVYPVDARGLMTDPSFSADKATSPMRPGAANAKVFSPPNIDTMIDLANRTGGRAFYNRNDIGQAVRLAAEDGKVTYTLGYYPTVEPDDKYHNLKIKVLRPGVTLRTRHGYYAYKDAKTDAQAIKTEVQRAIWSPLDATAVAVNARVDLNAVTNRLEMIVQVDDRTITFDHRGDRYVGRLDFGFAEKDEEGKVFEPQNDTLELNLTQASFDKLRAGGLLYRQNLARNEKAKTLRIVVRDGPSGLTGSVTVLLKDVQSYTPQARPQSPKL